jgi:FkbM family methyltransferase
LAAPQRKLCSQHRLARTLPLKERIPLPIRRRLRLLADRVVTAPARAAHGRADEDDALSQAYCRWYARRRFAPLRSLLPLDALVFDVGANKGSWTAALRSLGCRVVAVEPQTDCVAMLRERFARDALVTVVATAVGAEAGQAELFVAKGSEHATTSRQWMDDMVARAGFEHSYWKEAVTVQTRTLDDLIEEFGEPDYLKLDIEGSEPAALRGLSHSLPIISLEVHGETLSDACACLRRLDELGVYEYNLTPGDFPAPMSKTWTNTGELIGVLGRRPHAWQNVIARRLS